MKKNQYALTNAWKLFLHSLIVLFIFISITGCSEVNKKGTATGSDYNPAFWLDGGFNGRRTNMRTDSLTALLADIHSKGWNGVTYGGAQSNGRNGATMDYYFKSPFLEKQPWAVFKNDGLSPLIEAAHKNGVKVMINIEGINPYHWITNKWTPENIRPVAADLAASGVDILFEESFDNKAEVFTSLAGELKSKGTAYISGTDPQMMLLAYFTDLWPQTDIINMYNYYLKRDKVYNIASLAQQSSLGFGWAKYWGKPTSLISPIGYNWGIATDYSPAVIPYMCMITALQFRLDNFMIWGAGLKTTFDPVWTKSWIQEYITKQEKDRPLMDIVVLLKKQSELKENERGNAAWNNLLTSSDAITSGAMNAGYNIIVSDKVVPADAYWIYTPGGSADVLPEDVVALFSTGKPVFIQCASNIPGGPNTNESWKTVLAKCGVDAAKSAAVMGRESQAGPPPQESKETTVPYTGYYKDIYMNFTGTDTHSSSNVDLRTGTIIPKEAISGTIYCAPNKTYSRGPFITGINNKYLVTLTALAWQVSYPVSDLLSGAGIHPDSNVWGIAGKKVTALLAIETTGLEIKIPGLADGSKIHVVVWDKKKNKRSEETVTYKAPYKHFLYEYDLILIDAVK